MYTAEEIEQDLLPSVDALLQGIEDFNKAATARVRSGSYNAKHLSNLNHLRQSFIDIETRLVLLKKLNPDYIAI